jgi:hypothetical protein
VLSGGALYYYVIDEYRVSNELLTEDIYVSSALLPPTLPIHQQEEASRKRKRKRRSKRLTKDGT